MQTFLPYPNFAQSAQVLDNQRLGKQRVEAKQILDVITGNTGHWKNPNAWRNHPAVLMWVGFDNALEAYLREVIIEWTIKRRKKHDFNWCHVPIMEQLQLRDDDIPPWLGNRHVHSSHRAALLYKKPSWYGKFGWTDFPEINYVWPV